MSIVYFDICAIPLFLMILLICYIRKMTKGNANQLFIVVVLFSLFSSIADICLELANNTVPLNTTGLVVGNISIYLYLILRNANLLVLILFLLALTKTTFILRKRLVRILFFIPYACILVMLAANPFTQHSFSITAEVGYARGPLMMVFYGIAFFYGIAGLIYCIYCRRYLPVNKFAALISVYVLNHIAVLIQLFYPKLLLEMFCTALGEMVIMLSIMRPEERMDIEVGMLSWSSYQTDVRNIIISGEHVQILVIRILNDQAIRNYLGEQRYNRYLSEFADGIRMLKWKHPRRVELYYERPGTIYLITEADEDGTKNIDDIIISGNGNHIKLYEETGIRFEPQICLIRCPEDLSRAEDIISLGHKFNKVDNRKQNFYHANEIVKSRSFIVESHIEEILDRAIKDNHIKIYYQPIFDVRSGRFRSAEALARIIDPEFDMVSPAIFIPAAEAQGLIVPLGDEVLDQVFRFVSELDFESLGLSYIEMNLSVAQCMERDLPDKIYALQQKYNVGPHRINLEITESTFENISEIMSENISKLIQMGYSFSLDDYGIGYSNIQRVNMIPLEIVKTDKSMLDEVPSSNGRKIMEYTIHMMQSIGKKLVVEGAETAEVVDILKEMDCDYIQGFYYSKPVPEDEFVRFIREQNCGK